MEIRQPGDLLGPENDVISEKWKMRNTVPPSAGGEAPTKQEDDKAFLARWIAYGKHLKIRADAHGVKWQGVPFETWHGEIILAEEWAKGPQEYLE